MCWERLLSRQGSSSRVCVSFGRVSSPGGFHPEALSEPYVTLSRHTAPIKLRTCFFTTEAARPGLNPQVPPIAG